MSLEECLNKRNSTKDSLVEKTISVTLLATKLLEKITNETTENGNLIHKYIECYFKRKLKKKTYNLPEHLNDDFRKIFNNFLLFLKNTKYLKIDKFEQELKIAVMKDEKEKIIVGKIDAIFVEKRSKTNYNPNKYYIVDWKTSKQLTSSQFLKYKITMNIYAALFKTYRPEAEIELWVVLLPSDSESFILRKIPLSNFKIEELINEIPL